MDIRKTKINGKVYDVCTLDNYVQNPSLYKSSITAIEVEGYTYPIRQKYDNSPGIYVGKDVSLINYPENKSEYSVDKLIDFNNLTDIRDAMEKQKMVKDMEKEILSNQDNITHFQPDPDDSPMMAGLKEAINRKHCNLDAYASRIGPNYNNDRRLFTKHKISSQKAESICTSTDIKMTVTFEDMSPDVANPMREPVTIVLNGEN